MIHKLINHWNERPSAFLQNPCASDLKLNKGAIFRRLVSFRTQTSLSYNSSSLMATGYPSSVWEVADGREKEFPVNMLYSSIFFFFWKCPVKSSPVLSNAKVSPVSPPLSSLDEIRDLTVIRPAFAKFARDMVFKKKMVFGIEMKEFRDAEMLWHRNRKWGIKTPRRSRFFLHV